MGINDPRIGPLCSCTESSWMVFRVGKWEGREGTGKGYVYINRAFDFRELSNGFIEIDTFSLPKEYAL